MEGQDLNTVLAALRWYQHCGMGDPFKRPDWLHDIATDGDSDISMDAAGIDDLCVRLNTGEGPQQYVEHIRPAAPGPQGGE